MVYFIEALETEQVKIGFTAAKTVDTRLKQLQTGCAQTLKVRATLPEGTKETEKDLHRRYKHLRIQREWFALGIDLERYLLNLDQDKNLINEYIKSKAVQKYWLENLGLSPAEIGLKYFDEFYNEAVVAFKKFEVK